MLLQGKNIKLRAVEPEDLELLYRWENNSDLWTISNTITPYSRFQIKEFIATEQDIFTSKQLRLMVEREGRAVGCVDLYDYDVFHQRAAVGIMIDLDSRNRGIACEALLLLAEYAFSFLKLQQLYCYVSERNTTSVSLFEKAGFRQTGKLCAWIRTLDNFENVFIYQLINDR
jgi:diamine N-acetyltransferase